jgi:hypothetical protein
MRLAEAPEDEYCAEPGSGFIHSPGEGDCSGEEEEGEDYSARERGDVVLEVVVVFVWLELCHFEN